VPRITPKFVEFIPKVVEDGVLYISEEYGTASHNCACGCGTRVVTPLSPTDWKLKVSRGNVSLSPSIGNWDYPCRSHYWIRNNEIVWAPSCSKDEIAAGRRLDWERKDEYYLSQASGSWIGRLWKNVWKKFGSRG
jgi:hypothetical protein